LKTLRYSLYSITLYLILFIPIIIYNFNGIGDKGLFSDFFKYYFIGFHLRFLLHRLPDALIMFAMIWHNSVLKYLTYMVPSIFILQLFFEKDKHKRLLGYLISVWFIVPLFCFTLYGGPISEYYLLFTVPMVLYILVYLQEKLFQFKFIPSLIILIIFWSIYTFFNTQDQWIKPVNGGLAAQKESTKQAIKNGGKIEYNEGDIKSYLYTTWVEDKKKF
jgi:hypothetical protein